MLIDDNAIPKFLESLDFFISNGETAFSEKDKLISRKPLSQRDLGIVIVKVFWSWEGTVIVVRSTSLMLIVTVLSVA